MILSIKQGNKNPGLRDKSKPVSEITKEIRELIVNMKETLARAENGIGLAAAQIGKNLQIFVIDPEFAREEKTVFVNPVITKLSKNKVVLEEGCLSLPGDWHELARPEKVTIKALDENGQKFKFRAKGLLARLIIHEVDHLGGVLFTDHLSNKN